MEAVLSIRLDDELVPLLDEEAARAKVSRSAYIRSVLRARPSRAALSRRV